MNTSTLVLLILGCTLLAYYFGLKRSLAVVGPGKTRDLAALPGYYGHLTALWCAVPAVLFLLVWMVFQDQIITQLVVRELPAEQAHLDDARMSLVINDIKNAAQSSVENLSSYEEFIQAAAQRYKSLVQTADAAKAVLVLLIAALGAGLTFSRIRPTLRARTHVETFIKLFLILSSTIAVLTTLGILLSVLFESIRFFQIVPLTEFLFGLQWSPQMAIRADQEGSSGAFGTVPLVAGTLLISFIAMVVAVPVGLMSAIYLAEYADKRVRTYVKPLIEVLAGIPTVVYGFFAVLVVAPLFRSWGTSMGLDVSSESALAAGVVMGIMIIPFVSSLSDDVINAVPQSLRDGAYALGSTRSETIRQVVLPAALPGVMGGILLAASRAIGETMIVVMAAGLSAKLTANPLESVTTVTVQIVTLLVGDQEFDSPKTLAAFALGLLLFFITLCLNIFALHIVKKYREQYE
ncbi:MAG: phosphate ABC transporter permease subunit PstC [Gammaproteobacteria bacterium]|nr:phosphate ABC transporter permease subunit PstC [Gammaproteobacteria bacterium]